MQHVNDLIENENRKEKVRAKYENECAPILIIACGRIWVEGHSRAKHCKLASIYRRRKKEYKKKLWNFVKPSS